jgi:hypothetical protein
MIVGGINMDVEIIQRQAATEELIKEHFARSLAIMLQKNRDRGDAWRGSGLMGQFIEIHSMYCRLRNLIWEMGPPDGEISNSVWTAEVMNALEDLRNFTMLGELCVLEQNWKGHFNEEL